MKTLKKTLQVIVIAGLMSLLPISSAMAMGIWPFQPGHGTPGRPGNGGGRGNGGGTSVPEPSAMLLLASAGGGIFILRRYLKKR